MHESLIGSRSSHNQLLVVVSVLILLYLATISPTVTNSTGRSSREAVTQPSASSLRSNPLQTSSFPPNATISVQPNATIDLSRTLKRITIEIALRNTPDVPPFNSISVQLAYDPHVLDAYQAGNLTYSSNVLAQSGFPSLVVRNCLDGHAANNGASSLCGSEDGPGIVSFAETILGGSTPDGTAGNVFFLTLAVNTTSPAFSQINIVHAILANGNTSIPTTNLDGLYSSLSCGGSPCSPPKADFNIQANPSSLTIHKSNVNDPFATASSTVTLMSLGGFSGSVLLQERIEILFPVTNPSNPPSLGLTVTPSPVFIAANSTATANLMVSAENSPPGTYFVNITGTQLFFNGTLGTLHHSAGVTVQVTAPPPDFQILLFNQGRGNVIFAGSDATLAVEVESLQAFSGTVVLSGQVFPLVRSGPTLSFIPSTVDLSSGFANSQLTVSTTALTPSGNYTISVTGTSGSLIHTAQIVLTVLPPPVLVASPSSGPVGTLVTVHGSGFITPNQGPFSFPIEIQMTFDDQLVGLLITRGSSFNFTFNVPISQVGMHQIHAKESFPSTLDIQTTFLVTPAPGGLSVSISAGTIYFRGDTASIFIGTSLNGQAITVSNLQVILILPNGSNTSLSAVQTSAGYYRATYLVPSTGSLGTYAVLVTAQLSGASAQSALTTFEVKPTWLQSNAHNIATATGVVGAVGALGIVALAWRRGFFARKSGSFPDF